MKADRALCLIASNAKQVRAALPMDSARRFCLSPAKQSEHDVSIPANEEGWPTHGNSTRYAECRMVRAT